jgi:regulator of sigma E protease
MLSHILINPVVDVIIMLGTLVFIHEFGHYAAAKLFGVRVEVFSLGFGKRLFGFRRGDTDYRVSALPLGGYVKMSGENPMEDSTGDPGEFMAHPRWQRFIIALAGPVMNIGLAIVVLTIAYMLHHERPYFLDEPPVILSVEENSAAAKAGLEPNDRIVRADGANTSTWEGVLDRMLINIGQPVSLDVQRGNQTLTKEVTIATGDVNFFDQLGISVEPYVVKKVTEGDPAQKAGMKVNDEIISVNGKPVHSTSEFSDVLKQTGDKPTVVQVKRDGALQSLTMTPRLDNEGPTPRYIVGFYPDERIRVEKLPFSVALAVSLDENKKNSLLIVEVLKKLVKRPSNIKQFSGPIDIARISERAARAGFVPFIELMSLISLNLGLFNLLPIPILDGGLILLLCVEGALRRDIRREVKERVYQAAFVFLIIFAAVVIYHDITKTALGRLLHM